MNTSTCIYHHGDQELHGFLAFDKNQVKPRPAVLVAHDWTGRNNFACDKALMLSEMGYVGFAIDMYGKGINAETNDEKMALMQPLMADRRMLGARIQTAYDTVAAMPEVDSDRIAAIGFCFGGLCVLDLARSGAHLKGVVSFHGLLNKPDHVSGNTIQAKVLALHGFDDPMVRPEDVTSFCQEMTDAKVDWQVHQYGLVKHAFTNPLANDPVLGTVYNARAEKRAFQAMSNFLNEIMQD